MSKPSFAFQKTPNWNLVVVCKIKETVTLNKPAYAYICQYFECVY